MKLPSSRVLELIIAASVVVISVASLFVALYQGRVMEQTMKASVLPVIEYSTGNFDMESEEPRITMTLHNNGLGPAEVREVIFRYNGEEFTSPGHLVSVCCVANAASPQEASAYLQDIQMPVITSNLRGRVMTQGQELLMLAVPGYSNEGARGEVYRTLDDARFEVEVEICYCSVFDDCWRSRYPDAERWEVASCIRRRPQDG
ncbi:hypothetical protein [Maricaulis sp.]|uniref:hypothetical protein n=1 Tax=unclassified Maricaulis TaxID=2632371 RepID=UPI001B069F47|nr:hypothetical protein [Maricaulis sp.]MBO6795870.1 hypothetical protein [Maricaulis sp.]